MTTYTSPKLDASEIHRLLAGGWPALLERLGIAPEFLSRRHGPCPACGGKDRYRFTDRHGRGDWFCNICRAGDGFTLLQRVHGWSFSEARRAVIEAAGLGHGEQPAQRRDTPRAVEHRQPEVAQPTARVRTLVRTTAAPEDVPCTIAYLRSRGLWPLPVGCTWRAHAAVDYIERGDGKAVEHVGRFPALVAPMRDRDGELVTVHLTYLHDGQKLPGREPRKLMSGMQGRVGCAVRLLPLAGDVLGVAEGIETALSASVMQDGMPVWAALNTSLLARFVPPPEVHHLVVFADRDTAGLEAAWRLRDEADGRCTVELRLPPAPHKDWNDALCAGVRS